MVGLPKGQGPDFGYCPKPAKTTLITKNNSLKKSEKKLFKKLASISQTKMNATLEQ